MRSLLVLLLSAAGTLAGFAYGRSQWSDIWPELSRLNLTWTVGVGWLTGTATGVCAARAMARWRGRGPGRKVWWRRIAEGSIVVMALAPGAIWIMAVTPAGLMREAGPVTRLLGERRPNIVLIGIDALRPDHLGAYGSRAGLTPNLDEFAREATRYEAAYAASSWTLPSFGALLALRSPSESVVMFTEGEDGERYFDRAAVFADAPLLAERLSSEGYRTAAELTNPFLAGTKGWERGIDFFRNEDGSDTDALLTMRTTRAEIVTGNACDWLRLNRYQPFFLWMHYLDPHAPYGSPETPEELRRAYPGEWETARRDWYEEMQDAPAEVRARYQQFCREMYAEEVRYADRCVGKVLTELKRRGIYDNSIVVILSDHGEELFDRGGFEHGHSMHEEVLRVPLLVKWPKGVEADAVVGQTVALGSVTATVLELAGCPPMDGTRVTPLPRWDGGPGAEVFSEGTLHGVEQTALTTDEYKVIYRPGADEGGGAFEVYDRRRDRGERHDLAGTGAASELRARLRALTEEAQATRARRGESQVPRIEMTEEERRRLKSLGYLSD
ncbi:MAG TPA: sulfatase [Armatimonadota bacterium]|nr:sulfatase [Armatimonadota bacterium]